MLERFHNEDYDGIVIKIPRFFIEMNELEEPLAQLLAKLKACKKSMYLPEHQSNIKELEEYKEKIEQLNAKEELEAERKKQAEEYTNKLISGEIVLLEWEKRTVVFYDTIVLSTNPDDNLDIDDCLNPKSVKADIQKRILEKCSTFEGLRSIMELSGGEGNELRVDMHYAVNSPELFNLNEVRVYNSQKGGLGISYSRLVARTDVTKTDKGGTRYFLRRLDKADDGTYFIDQKDPIRYKDYEMWSLRLIKKKQEPNGNKES